MPTIESKKYGHTQFITAEAWEQFKRLGKDRYFKIVDDSDIQETVIPTPESIVEFPEAKEVTIPTEETVKDIELSRDEIKDELDRREIEYNTRASTENLKKLLE